MLHASDIRKASSSHACPRPARQTIATALVLLLALCSRPAAAGLDLTWNACNQEAAGRGDLTFDCADTDQVATLFGNFQVPATIPDFFALDAVLDIEVNGAGVPPFWHFETGGCNDDGLSIHIDRPPVLCPDAGNANPWGASGTADAFITGYGVGFGGANHARLLLTIARASTNTTTLDGGRNYYAFHLDLPAKRGNACDGCASPAGIAWSTASLYGTQGATTVVSGAGLRSNIVSINGGTIDTGPTVSIADTKVVEGESGTPAATFTVSLSSPVGVPVTVDYQTSDGTATLADQDYSETHGTLTIPALATSAIVTVPVSNGDPVSEPDETFFVDLSNAAPVRIDRGRATGTISNHYYDNEISISDASVVEGNSSFSVLSFTVTVTGRNAQIVRVGWETLDGTAYGHRDFGDFEPSSGVLAFSTGQTSRTVQIAVIGDVDSEPDETLFVRLSNPSNGVIRRGQAVGTILDDDRPGVVYFGDVAAAEGDAGTRVFRFPVQLGDVVFGTTTVDYQTVDGTATVADGDYQPASGTLTFPPGAFSDTIRVTVAGDTRIENNETFLVRLSHPVGLSYVSDSVGVGTIQDDDRTSLAVTPAAIDEGNTGLTPLIVSVTLSGNPVSDPVDVDWRTGDGSATVAGDDYVAASGHLTFPPGTTLQTLTVQVRGDDVDGEGDETFAVFLEHPVNAIITAPGFALVTIRNDDPVPALSIDDVTDYAQAFDWPFVFTVRLDRRSSMPILVYYATLDSTATAADGDYTPTSGRLVFDPGTTEATITVMVHDNHSSASAETFQVRLTNPLYYYANIADAFGLGTILPSGGETPTLVTQFRADPASTGITLRWELHAPEQIQRLDLERAEATDGSWTTVTADRREDRSVTSVLDPAVASGHTYFYRLLATLRDGPVEVFGPISARAADAITAFALSPVAPNPGAGPFRFEYALPIAANVRVSVVDVQGREVALVEEDARSPGRYSTSWDGRSAGSRLPAGLYFVRYQAAGKTFVRRIALAH
jgi:hypothetical protein